MKTILKKNKYDTRLETSDWRYNASIVGLSKYFDYHTIEYHEGLDYIKYNSSDISEEKYLLFAEDYFKEKMHHRLLETLVSDDEFTPEQEKLINDKLKANAIMKKIFKGIKFEKEAITTILDLINHHRLELIKETFKNGASLYANFNNTSNFLKDVGRVCRVLGYTVDIGKKGKSIAYNWNFSTYNAVDDGVFDFIPFAFSKSREAFFINNNLSIKMLLASNRNIVNIENPRKSLFCNAHNSATFIQYDVETIIKRQDQEYYETLFIRDEAIKVFKKIENYEGIIRNIKLTDKYYINLEKEVTNSILNGIKLDALIEKLLNLKKDYSYNINTLIRINNLIYGGNYMDDKMKMAYACAKSLTEKFKKEKKSNKITTYKNKLISALTFKDYDRFCEVLLQLSVYSGIVFSFAYELFEDFDANKRIAYTFVNALNVKNNTEGEIGNE